MESVLILLITNFFIQQNKICLLSKDSNLRGVSARSCWCSIIQSSPTWVLNLAAITCKVIAHSIQVYTGYICHFKFGSVSSSIITIPQNFQQQTQNKSLWQHTVSGNADVCQLSYYFHTARTEPTVCTASTPTAYQVGDFSFTALD